MKKILLVCLLFCAAIWNASGQSIAREWNEEVLNAIRNDFARPTVHARNLWHTSAAMYDVWAVFNPEAETYFLGKSLGDFSIPFDGFTTDLPTDQALEEALSFAVFRIMLNRFSSSPGQADIFARIFGLMEERGYDITNGSTEYQSGDPAALGNYLAQQIIEFGLQDGSNEAEDYANRFYQPVNSPLDTDGSGNPDMEFPNRWQPLFIEGFIDQSGNEIPETTPEFLSPEWGQIYPFALKDEDRTVYNRDDFDYWVFHDPGDPSLIQDGLGLDDPYKWGFTMVSVWQSHLDPTDEVMIDISPASIGNQNGFPESFEDYKAFYNYFDGGDPSSGHDVNPITGAPYEPQMVPRGDYTRVLAEFWADGPDSETPPGHWFTILNYVNDNPLLEKRFKGAGEVLSDLEWDIKSYFLLGGAMHDCAISAWGVKGWYDYTRPMSAIRYMAEKGQSTDTGLSNYHPEGIPLIEGYVEIVEPGDPLEGASGQHLGKIKLYTWRGHEYIIDPEFDTAGVGWILAEEWFPYQRISFITPPFAGYVSGHSTYSRAAAEILTALTGSEYFPGGMGVFDIPANAFLEFEIGPTVDMQLQWATYRDASDQTSLSRIWGGIHPPIDDIPGRRIGIAVAEDAFALAETYFGSTADDTEAPLVEGAFIYPNPVNEVLTVQALTSEATSVEVYDLQGRRILQVPTSFDDNNRTPLNVAELSDGVYFVVLVRGEDETLMIKRLIKQ
ncbi:T9SS type A sorting domain-containing protein [Gilvibacter sediminis]|uniref:T9SS type A sorting domain-containing protein n=1 Tax=Gilvibacter sediminis TaxID=379071 RepID=UPI002350E1C6|nr:T9SS type A sorting domain-containing protein [Gilvibacter sediminis]MDC7998552.1 T9SS type A sorting domain-containing protein [Gilvibacter sediminis]